MKNQSFVQQNDFERQRKLRIVLRQLTANGLTEEQTRIIEQASGHRQQNYFYLYTSSHLFLRAIDESADHNKNAVFKTLFGSIDAPPTAVLVRRTNFPGIAAMICIYLPDKNEKEK